MINGFIKGIAKKLNELYPDYNIYTEYIPQNFKKPCFVIKLIESEFTKRLHNRDETVTTIRIRCMVESGYNGIYNEVMENFNQNLNLVTNITDGSQYRPRDMNTSFFDEEIEARLTFAYWTYREVEQSPLMESLEIEEVLE